MRYFLAFLVIPALLFTLPTAIVSAESTTQCGSLRVTLSPDKNYYIFTATAVGDTDSITGYTFDFGDRQTYAVTFGTSAGQDRHAASTTHVYQNAQTYTPSVQVLTSANGKHAAISSPGCQTSLSIPPAGNTTLPSAGVGGTLQLFAVTLLAGFIAHQLWLRRRIRA